MNDGSPHAPTLAVTTERFVGGDAGEAVTTNGAAQGKRKPYAAGAAVLDVGRRARAARWRWRCGDTAGLASGAGSEGSRFERRGSGGGALRDARRTTSATFSRRGDDDARMDFEAPPVRRAPEETILPRRRRRRALYGHARIRRS